LYPGMFTMSNCAGFPVGVTVRIKLQRASQTYVFPFHLSDEVILQPIFYGKKTSILSASECHGHMRKIWSQNINEYIVYPDLFKLGS
jgi:hypothetical protein